jgi:hypothetical protein
MSWKKYFNVPSTTTKQQDPSSSSGFTEASKFASWLPEVYVGQPNRLERYGQYEIMDMDSEINAALDTISEFSTQFDSSNLGIPFEINYKTQSTEAEVTILEKMLKQWSTINEWDKRIFRIFRNTVKYGDQFFVRDPETYEMFWVNPANVTKAIINESTGKDIEQYVIQNLDFNLQAKTASEIISHNDNYNSLSTMQKGGIVDNTSARGGSGQSYLSGSNELKEFGVGSEHVVHFSLTEGLDDAWPFGQSILDPVFKTYKQKELLEDSIIIYRVQRAPERRVFYIDTGNMPTHKAMSFVERVKNEIHQRRIPSKTGGGATVMDASYNPLSIMEDYFFAQTAEGRGSKVETLPGGENLGQIDDLKFFTNKILRALRVPSSYLPTGPDDGTAAYQDGKVGTALIQEFRFHKYCTRIQNILAPLFDQEFKMYLKWRGTQIDSSTFELRFFDPQGFSDYRSIDLNTARISTFTQVSEMPFMSRRFALKKYLGWSEDEIIENERAWFEENDLDASGAEAEAETAGLGNVGISPVSDMDVGGMDLEGDIDMEGGDLGMEGGDMAAPSPITGAEGGEPGVV